MNRRDFLSLAGTVAGAAAVGAPAALLAAGAAPAQAAAKRRPAPMKVGCQSFPLTDENLRKLMVSSMMNGDEGMEDDPELESLMGGIMGCAFMGMGEDLGETDGMGEDTTTTAA